MYEHLVLGVDGSKESTMAVHWCAAVASNTGAAVTVVHGLSHWVDRHYAALWPDLGKLQSEVEARMRAEWCKPLEDAGVELEYQVVADDPASGLLAAARTTDADMVVLGRHGRGAWAPNLIGSVAHKVLHDPPCPIVVVPGPESQPDRVKVERQVVAGVDGSHSAAALEWAVEHARLFDLGVRAVGAVFTQVYHEAAWLAEIDDAAAVAAAEQELRPMVAALARQRGVEIPTDVVVGYAGSTLVEQSRDAELLVVGTRAHGAIRELIVGSVGHYCAARAACPTVLVP